MSQSPRSGRGRGATSVSDNEEKRDSEREGDVADGRGNANGAFGKMVCNRHIGRKKVEKS